MFFLGQHEDESPSEEPDTSSANSKLEKLQVIDFSSLMTNTSILIVSSESILDNFFPPGKLSYISWLCFGYCNAYSL